MLGKVVFGNHIVRTPGILGGDARLAGTRIALWHVADLLRTPEGVRQLMDDFPQLNQYAITEAVMFVHQRPEEIEYDRNRNATGLGEPLKTTPPRDPIGLESNP